MKSQDLFSLNKKKKKLESHLLQILLGALRVKRHLGYFSIFKSAESYSPEVFVQLNSTILVLNFEQVRFTTW